MQLYNVQLNELIPGKAEITEDKGMYSIASGGLGGPQTPALLHTVHVLITFCFFIMDVGISAKIQSCGFILPLRKNMIAHSFTLKFLYFLLL